MLIIGDVHGKLLEYRALLRVYNDPESIQLGDMGIGFKQWISPGDTHYFIRGNHDNPDLCKTIPNYLGDWGYLEKEGIFFLSGADSIDKDQRIEGKSWWRDEELSYAVLQEVIEKYENIKPDIMLTHECPFSVCKMIHSHHGYQTRTNQALQAMFEIHQPKLWLFGHHHVSWRYHVKGTLFKCLNELEIVRLNEELYEVEKFNA